MNKNLVISTITAGLLASVNVQAADSLSTMFSEGKTSGQIRAFSVDREYQGTSGNTTHRNAHAVGGHLKFQTAEYHGLSLGAGFHTTVGVFNRGDIANNTLVDPSMLGPNNEDYSLLGEAYIQYKRGKTTFKGGRQKLKNAFVGTEDYRMMANMFEAYMLTNKDIADTTLTLGHITKFAQGTFGRVYGSGLLAKTGGYSMHDAKNQVGQFVNAGTYATGHSTRGITLATATYTGIKGLKLQVGDSFAHDIMNSIYAQADYKMDMGSVKPFVSAQLMKQNSTGQAFAGIIDSTLVGAKIGAKIGSFTAYVAHTQTGENSAADKAAGGEKNSIITMWGGMAGFTAGMVTRHMNFAGTKASKIVTSYSFKEMGTNLSTTAYYCSFDMDANSGYGLARTATEAGFDVIYYPEVVKNLQLRVRANFPRDFAEGTTGTTGWSEYRFIANYSF